MTKTFEKLLSNPVVGFALISIAQAGYIGWILSANYTAARMTIESATTRLVKHTEELQSHRESLIKHSMHIEQLYKLCGRCDE